jgi:membrane protease YdiL (CAAX protease family)
VYAIARPWEPHPGGLLSGTPLPLLILLAVVTVAAGALATAEVIPLGPARAVAAGAAQGALLATAVAWTSPRAPARGPAPTLAALLTLTGAVAAAFVPFGAIAYLAAPVWLWRERSRLPGLGLTRASTGQLTAGAALGMLLGTHLLLTASLTLGYGVRAPRLEQLGPWLAYDAGANVLATEAFFRGALFDRVQRRWPLAPAAALATLACLVRYLVDPLLPRNLEVMAGAVFYLTLLSLGACWLYWRSGSIVPGVAAGILFFACYRLLHVVQ